VLINVDFDGVIIPNTHEEFLFRKIKEKGWSFMDNSPVWDWYEKVVCNPLQLNIPFLMFLNRLKERKHYIRLWTNRAYTLKEFTVNNLGEYASIFDSFHFYNGCKSTSQVEGMVIDNSLQYLSCGEVGIHYKS